MRVSAVVRPIPRSRPFDLLLKPDRPRAIDRLIDYFGETRPPGPRRVRRSAHPARRR
jgi:hypothetical protein